MRVVLIVLSALAAGCAAPRTPEAPPTGTPLSVQIAPVTEGDWPAEFEAGGTVLARETAVVASRIVAPVIRVPVRPGDRVRRGQTLVELDGTDLRAQAAHAHEAAGAAEHAATAAAADLAAATAALELATATHTRVVALAADRSATRQELDEARAALASAEARKAAAAARSDGARLGIAGARAASTAAGVTATFSTLTAPFDGVVVSRAIDPGSLATPGTPLVVVEDRSAYRLEVRLDTARVGLLRIGQTVGVRPEGSTSSIDGRVAELSRIDPAGHSFAVKIDLPPGFGWLSGMYARARLAGPSRRVLSVPEPAIVSRGQLNYVYVVPADGVARLRAVSVGAVANGRIEILDGVLAGEAVVAPVPAGLADGAKVTRGSGQ